MHVSIDDFWKLATSGGLFAPDECQQLHGAFAELKGAAQQANARSLAGWLVAGGKLTRYQAAMLMAGRAGPFVFGPFVITDRIEKGRLARVYRATHENGQRALLVFLAQLSDDANEHQALVESAKAVAAVKNAHTSRTYGAVRHRSQTFIVVEDLDGQSLEEMLARQKIGRPEACRLGFQLALGLAGLHAENLGHGGVCPQNVWIDAGGTAKLLLFPLVPVAARLKRNEPPLVDYSAPELADRAARPSAVADVYSLGCTLFELVAGRPVFPGGTAAQRIARHRAEFPQRLDQLDTSVPEELADLVGEMLAKDPLLRCQTASEVAHLLAPFGTGEKRRGGHPPKLDATALSPGYGAWKAPEWSSPPRQTRAAPVSGHPPPAEAAPPAAERQANTDESGLTDSSIEASAVASAIVVGPLGRGETSSPNPADGIDTPRVVADEAATESVVLPPRRAPKSALVGVAAGLAVVLLAVIGAVVANRSERMANSKSEATAEETRGPSDALTPETSPTPPPDSSRPGAADGSRPDSSSLAPAVNLVDDDGETMWASPTSGRPLEATYLPNGTQVVIALRPAKLLGTSEGAKLLDALGPGGRWVEEQLRATLGVGPADVEQLIVAFADDPSRGPQATLVMRLARETPQATLLTAWGNPVAVKHQGKSYFRGDRHAYYSPASGAGRVVVVAPTGMIKPILDNQGSPLLRRSVERLLGSSDDSRHVTVLFTPSYLLFDGKSLLAGELAKLRGPLRDFLDESIEAVLLSGHVGEELFVEFRAVAPLDAQPLALLRLLESRLDGIPDRLEALVASLEPHPHGRLVINRFPRMVQLARDFTRGAVEDKQVVLRAYLPQSAAHNLAMGAELTLFESSGSAAGSPAKPQRPSVPRSAADSLKQKISLSFPRESLDRAVDVLSRELDVTIVILGSDLQLEGITKNQPLVDFDQRDRPGDAVLRKILKLANPDGKLVYVIRPNDDGRETVFVTTRAAAAKRGEKLPDGF